MQSIYFTEEHHLFRDSVRAFCEKEIMPHAEQWEREQRIPRDLWRKMGGLGFLGINFPETYGGAEADIFFSVIFLEELGKTGLAGLCAAVAVQQYMATAHIHRHGSEDLKRRYLTPSIAGEAVGALAVSEPDAGSDVAAIRTSAVLLDGDYILNGSKTFITNGYYGDFVTVAAKTDVNAGTAGISLFVVDSNSEGFSTQKLDKMGWHCSDTAELAFENVKVPAANLIGERNMGFYSIMECFQLERLVGALTAIGGAEGCLEITRQYALERRAFKRPVAKFQVIRHQLAELHTELEAVRQLTYHTAWMYERGMQTTRECSMVKMKATELGKQVADACLQIFGGYGFMNEYPVSRMYRDARVGTIVGGTTEIMREIIAKIIIDDVKYDASPKQGGKAAPGIAQVFKELPDRFIPEEAADMCLHFDFSADGGGQFSVSIQNRECRTSEGLQGEPTCLVTAPAAVYLDIELGRLDPQTALMSGKAQVSNVTELMRFSRMFKRLQRS